MKKISLFLFIATFLSCSSTEQQASIAQPLPVTADTTKPYQAPEITNEFLTGHFSPSSHPDFVTVGAPYSNKPGMMLQKEVFDAFKKMYDAAKKDGIALHIISSTRTFEQQKNIWEGKWTRFADTKEPVDRAKRILEYSSMPGSSRHHWGTDMDFNDLNNPSFEGKGAHAKVYEWLSTHAATYGFGQPYTPLDKERPHGYHEEKWHWSYLPLAKKYRETYLKNIKNSDITGFKGAETATSIQVVEHYVGGVSKNCQ